MKLGLHVGATLSDVKKSRYKATKEVIWRKLDSDLDLFMCLVFIHDFAEVLDFSQVWTRI